MSILRAKDWIDLPTNVSLSELMEHNVSNTKDDKVILEDVLAGKTATYGALREQWKRSAHWLQKQVGLLPGQTVSLVSPSCVDYVLVEHSVWCAGAIVNAINHSLRPVEIAHAINIVEPSLVVVHSSICDNVEAALSMCKSGFQRPQILTIGPTHAGHQSFPVQETSSGSEKAATFSLKGRDSREVCAAVLMSSGTSGNPKAVMLSHYNLVSACLQLRSHNPDNWRGSQREIFFPHRFKVSHVYGLYLMDSRKATLARLVPPVAKALAESPIARKYSYPALEYFSCSAAPLNGKVAADLQDAFPHVTLCQTYGCTELSGAIVQSGVRDKSLSLINTGTPISNIELRFLDDDGKDIGARGPGEITIRGPNLMMGYKGDDEATKQALAGDGWYRSGDVGYIDDNGYLVISDRIKDVIKVKGFQVSPTELEKVLAGHVAVREAAVCSVYSEQDTSDVPQAFVVLKEPIAAASRARQLASDIAGFVAARVSGYKQLRGGVVFVPELPRNPTGKLLRRVLRDMATTNAELVSAKL